MRERNFQTNKKIGKVKNNEKVKSRKKKHMPIKRKQIEKNNQNIVREKENRKKETYYVLNRIISTEKAKFQK